MLILSYIFISFSIDFEEHDLNIEDEGDDEREDEEEEEDEE